MPLPPDGVCYLEFRDDPDLHGVCFGRVGDGTYFVEVRGPEDVTMRVAPDWFDKHDIAFHSVEEWWGVKE